MKIIAILFLLLMYSCKPSDPNKKESNASDKLPKSQQDSEVINHYTIDDEIISKTLDLSVRYDFARRLFRIDLSEGSIIIDSLVCDGIHDYYLLNHRRTFCEFELEVDGSNSVMKNQLMLFVRNGKITVAYFGNSLMSSNIYVLTKSNKEMHEEIFYRGLFFYNQATLPYGNAHFMEYSRVGKVDIDTDELRADSTSRFIVLKRDSFSGVYYEKMIKPSELGLKQQVDQNFLIPVIVRDNAKQIYLNHKWMIIGESGELFELF